MLQGGTCILNAIGLTAVLEVRILVFWWQRRGLDRTFQYRGHVDDTAGQADRPALGVEFRPISKIPLAFFQQYATI